jgi:hypothetical protein
MDRLFAPGLKPWNANKVVMAEVRAIRGFGNYAHEPSIDSEEKGSNHKAHSSFVDA